MDIEEMMIDFLLNKANDEQIEEFSDMHHMDSVEKILEII